MFVTKTFPPLQIKCFHKDTIHLYLENLSCHERSQYFIGKTRCQKSHLQDSEVLEEVFCPFLLADRLHPWQKRVTSLYGKAWFKESIACLNKIIPVSKSLISLQGGDILVLSLLGCFTFKLVLQDLSYEPLSVVRGFAVREENLPGFQEQTLAVRELLCWNCVGSSNPVSCLP